ncbi:unnamed protein product [Peronospora belbahrii]|uniref:Uncharacterized protein n=1 Tax=Peronospora belbahrii TaxID=622444 RepID=A0AAU9LBT4_9STRA|nr:unnamed protein product [Peronospora belbahrii]
MITGYEPNFGFANGRRLVPASAAPCREMNVREPAVVVDAQAHERGASTDDRVLTMLQALETSQMQVDEEERLPGAIDADVNALELDRGMGGTSMHRTHLATTRRDQHANECAWRNQGSRSLNRLGRNEAADNSKLGNKYYSMRRRRLMSISTCQRLQCFQRRSNKCQCARRKRQRNLAIQKFDRSKLYQGLGSGFSDWRRTFLR